MTQTQVYQAGNPPAPQDKATIIRFLHTHLEQFGDKPEDIEKAIDYAMDAGNEKGGFVTVVQHEGDIAAVAVINRTGMSGYIPENILVYIATHKAHRGKGIATKLMHEIMQAADDSIALHVEHDNPAIKLYRKLGFTNKYLEMRWQKQ